MSEAIMLKDAASIPHVVAALTLEEKARLVAGATVLRTAAVERLGIPAMVPADGHNGINVHQLLWNTCYWVHVKRGQGAEKYYTLFDVPWDMPGIHDLLIGQADPAMFDSLPPQKAAFYREVAEEWKRSLPEGGLPLLPQASSWAQLGSGAGARVRPCRGQEAGSTAWTC